MKVTPKFSSAMLIVATMLVAITISFLPNVGYSQRNVAEESNSPQQQNPTEESNVPQPPIRQMTLFQTTPNIPGLMSYQGTLTDASGKPVTTLTSVTFAIYSSATGGVPLWSEPQTVTPSSTGAFSVILGSVAAFPSTLFKDNPTLYLGLRVGADAEMTPRQRIMSAAFAFSADTASPREGYGNPVAVGSANSAGTAITLARSDHVHQGLHSINGLFGDVTIRGSGIYVTTSGQSIEIDLPDKVRSIGVSGSPALFGDVTLAAGTGVTLSQAGSTITISGGTLGVSGSPALFGNVTLAAGTGVTLSQAGSTITIASASTGTATFSGSVTSNTAVNVVDARLTHTFADSTVQRVLFLQNADDAAAGSGTIEALIALENNDANELVTDAILFTAGGANAPDFTNGINFDAADFTTEIVLENAETISNQTDDNVAIAGVGGTNNETLTIDLDSAAASGPTLSSPNTHILINDNLSVGIDGNVTENIADAGFAFSGNDLYVDDKLGVNGNAFFEGNVTISDPSPIRVLISAETPTGDVLDLLTVKLVNQTINSQLHRAVVISNAATNNSAADPTEALLVLDNADNANIGATVVIDALRIESTGNFGNSITNAINIADTDVATDIKLQNGETIDNNTDGTVDISGEVLINLDGDATTTEALCGNQADGNAADTIDIRISDCSDTPTADYAEQYPVAPGITYGDIVVPGTREVITKDGDRIVELVKSSKPYQEPIVGIVSNNYGDFTSAGYNINEEDNPMPIALVGRVPVNVTDEGGPISVGDFLTTSSTPGHAMKATRSGRVIGMALSNFNGKTGQVMVQVLNSWWNAPVVDQADNNTTSRDTAGTAFVKQGQTKVAVIFAIPYKSVPEVTATPKANPGSLFWISDVIETGFTINLASAVESDVPFGWIALGVNREADNAVAYK